MGGAESWWGMSEDFELAKSLLGTVGGEESRRRCLVRPPLLAELIALQPGGIGRPGCCQGTVEMLVDVR
eukprot:395591-Prorocentrum_minimum.AAC.1